MAEVGRAILSSPLKQTLESSNLPTHTRSPTKYVAQTHVLKGLDYISMDEDFTTSHGNLALVVTTVTIKVLSCGQMNFHIFWFVATDTVL